MRLVCDMAVHFYGPW